MLNYLLLVTVCLVASSLAEGPEFFRTNTDKYVNYPLKFDKPLPLWLKGSLIRNGIGRFEFGNRRVSNALDAYAKLSSFLFPGNGSAFFSTQLLQSISYVESANENDIAKYLLGEQPIPAFNPFESLEAFKNGFDNMNVNVLGYKDSFLDDVNYVAVSDCWKGYEFNPYNLSTVGAVDAPVPGSSTFDAPLPMSSGHPLPEPGTNNHLTILGVSSIIPYSKSKLKLIRIKSKMERELVGEVEVDQLNYMHSFPVSQNFGILVQQPLYIDISKMVNFSPLSAFKWDPTASTYFHAVNLKSGKVTSVKGDNLFYLHVVNAYEPSPTEIIIDLLAYKDNSPMYSLNMTKLNDLKLRGQAAVPQLKRVHLDLQTGNASYSMFPSSLPFINQLEYPTINEEYRSKKYCYIYGVSYNIDGTDFLHMALIKKDLCNGQDKYWHLENAYLSEAWFEPTPNAQTEDDGILLMPIFDKTSQNSTLTMFDAKTLTVINSAPLPTSNPFGTHGKFFPSVN